MEKFKRGTREIGNSLAITIPKDVVNHMHLNSGVILEVTIKSASDTLDSYVCPECKHPYASNSIKPFCPVCGFPVSKDLE